MVLIHDSPPREYSVLDTYRDSPSPAPILSLSRSNHHSWRLQPSGQLGDQKDTQMCHLQPQPWGLGGMRHSTSHGDLCAGRASAPQRAARDGPPSCPAAHFFHANGTNENYPQLWATPPIQSFHSFYLFHFFSPIISGHTSTSMSQVAGEAALPSRLHQAT